MEHDGKGGLYRIDPDTKERVLIERTNWTPPAEEPEESVAAEDEFSEETLNEDD